MTSVRKMATGRQCPGGWSLQRIWTVIVVGFMMLASLELRYMWLTVRSGLTPLARQQSLTHGHSFRHAVYSAFEKGRDPDWTTTDSVGKISDRIQTSMEKPTSIGLANFPIRKYKGKPRDKWIVLDVTSGDCLQYVTSAPSGWRVIVVGEKAPHSAVCKPPACTWLEPDANTTQGLSQTGQQLWRRNLAYLTAMSGGAKQIFDADCHAPVSADALAVLGFNSTKAAGLMYNATRLFNPYAHFGASLAVSLAVYKDAHSTGKNSRLYYVRDFARVYVKHGLSERSADIIRIGGTRPGSNLNVSRFDPSSPPVYVGQRSFSPVVSSCAIYHQAAFWALLLPCLSDAHRCDVMRQLIAQRMLRELDAFTGFYRLNFTSRFKTLKDDSRDAKWNTSSWVRFGVDQLVTFLDSWVCKPRVTFFGCLEKLANELRVKGFLEQVGVNLVKSWLSSLRSLGVAEPSRVTSPWRGVRKINEVPVLFRNAQAFLADRGLSGRKFLDKELVAPVRTQCDAVKNHAAFASVAQWRQPVITDIVLIVVFNYNKFLWKNLPYLETIHRPFFRHIVYCTPNITELTEDARSETLGHVTLVEGLSDEWYQMHECLVTVASMNLQGVRGYLQIGDDTLLNTWMLFNASRDTIWLPRGFTTVNVDNPKHLWGWYHWNKTRGRAAILRALSDMERLSGMTSEQILRLDPSKNLKTPKKRTFSEILRADYSSHKPRPQHAWADPTEGEAIQFLNNYIQVNSLLGKVAHRALDLFYIPHAMRDGYVKFSRYFTKHDVIIELAVPAIHYGLMRRSDVSYMRASSLWRDNRNSTWTFYDKTSFFLHPFKLHGHMRTAAGREFFCKVYARALFSKLAQMNTRMHLWNETDFPRGMSFVF